MKRCIRLRRMRLKMGEAAPFKKKVGFPQAPIFPKKNDGGVSLVATSDGGSAPRPRKLLKKFDQNFCLGGPTDKRPAPNLFSGRGDIHFA